MPPERSTMRRVAKMAEPLSQSALGPNRFARMPGVRPSRLADHEEHRHGADCRGDDRAD